MPPAPSSPSPSHLLRSHSTHLSALAFSDDNERIYSGDASGLVVITSTRSLRAIASWKAHTDSLLGVEEYGDRIITHGRDNKLHVWARTQEPTSIRVGGSAALPGLPTPTLCYSMDVNALNYCRFSLMPLPASNPMDEKSAEFLIAVPNLVESSLADIWTLPSCQRLHAAIGKAGVASNPIELLSDDGRGSTKTGIIMAMHLFSAPSASSSPNPLRLLCAYENGSVTLWSFTRTDKQTSVEGIGWEAIWSVKLHVESVMAMAVSRHSTLALTVSADHLIGRYDLTNAGQPNTSLDTTCTVHRTKHPGNSAVAIRDDGKVCAVGGWDGKIRLYSTKTLKPLGTLIYHKGNCQAVAFARSLCHSANAESRSGAVGSVTEDERSGDDDEDEMSEEERKQRIRWLVSGGKDHRVSIWELMEFEKLKCN